MLGGVAVLGAVIRFIVSAVVLLFVGYVVPGFRIFGFWNALIAAIAIAVVGYLVEAMLGRRVTSGTRGAVGFLTAAVAIYVVQFFIPTMRVSLLGALLASAVIGIIDMFVPTELR